jgi:hypothetical protein
MSQKRTSLQIAAGFANSKPFWTYARCTPPVAAHVLSEVSVRTVKAREFKMSVHTNIEAARHTTRKRVLMIGTLVTCSGAQRVRIRDFSSKGAQVIVENGFQSGCDVLLKRGDLCAAANVAWVKGDEVGLTFYRPISAEDLAAN